MQTFSLRTTKYLLIFILGLISIFLFFNATASNNLIAYWNFDEIEGWEAVDSSGNKLHAYIGTALSNVEGKKNYGLLFDGVRSYAAVDDNSLLDFGTNDSFSISAWVKLNNDIKDWRVIVGKAKNTSLDGYILRHNQNGNLAMMVEENNGNYQSDAIANQDYRDDKWHHLVGVIDRQNETNIIYVDGHKKGESSIANLGSLTNDYNLNIGSLQRSGGVSFGGLIDEVRIYNKALSLSEAQQLYNQDCNCSGVGIEPSVVVDPVLETYPAGSLLQAVNDYKIYYINKNGQKKWIVNQNVFNLYDNKWEDVIKVNSQDLAQYPLVNLVRGVNDYKVYLIDGTRKIWIETPQDFIEFGFETKNIDLVKDEEIFEYNY